MLVSSADDGWEAGSCYGHPKPDLWYSEDINEIMEAKSICYGCPLREACAKAGEKEEYGVWGGLTPEERTPRRINSALTRITAILCANPHQVWTTLSLAKIAGFGAAKTLRAVVLGVSKGLWTVRYSVWNTLEFTVLMGVHPKEYQPRLTDREIGLLRLFLWGDHYYSTKELARAGVFGAIRRVVWSSLWWLREHGLVKLITTDDLDHVRIKVTPAGEEHLRKVVISFDEVVALGAPYTVKELGEERARRNLGKD